MQPAPAKKRGRPRKNPLPYEDEVVPVVEQIAETPAVAEAMIPSGAPITVVGIRPCVNKRWVLADWNGELVKVKCLKSIKTPKGKRIKVQRIEDNFYEEIR